MGSVLDRVQAADSDVSITLCALDIVMAQQILNIPDIVAVSKHMRENNAFKFDRIFDRSVRPNSRVYN